MISLDLPQNNTYTPENIIDARNFSRNPSSNSTLSGGNMPLIRISLRTQPILEHIKSQFYSRIAEIDKLQNNWDGYGAIKPNSKTLKQVYSFIDGMQLIPLQYLDQEDIMPTPYGTIVMDFYRGSNCLSVEFGETTIGFFSEFFNGQKIKSEGTKFDRTALPDDLHQAFKIFLCA